MLSSAITSCSSVTTDARHHLTHRMIYKKRRRQIYLYPVPVWALWALHWSETSTQKCKNIAQFVLLYSSYEAGLINLMMLLTVMWFWHPRCCLQSWRDRACTLLWRSWRRTSFSWMTMWSAPWWRKESFPSPGTTLFSLISMPHSSQK